ncbi:MAG: hypothetical protein ACFFD2_12500 [Promethearchaeota archaeon]
MKIAILGSWRKENKDKFELKGDFNKFKDFCKKLGKSLAKADHEIIVGNYYEDPVKKAVVVEKPIIDGYLEQLRDSNMTAEKMITAIHPYGDFKRFQEVREENPTIFNFLTDIQDKDWGDIHVKIVNYSDLLIIIGGDRLTKSAGNICFYKKGFVVSIPNFGGAGKQLFELMQREASEKYVKLIHSINILNTENFDSFIENLKNFLEDWQTNENDQSYFQKKFERLENMISMLYVMDDDFDEFIENLKDILEKIKKKNIKAANGKDLDEIELNLLKKTGTILEMIENTKDAQRYSQALKAGRHQIYIRIDQWLDDHPNIIKLLKGAKKVTNIAQKIIIPLKFLSKSL